MSTMETDKFRKETAERLEWLMSDQNVDQTRFSERCGVTRSYMSSILSGSKGLSLNAAMSISQTLDVNLNWILQGKGAPYLMDTPATPTETDFVQVPRYDIQASAGHGSAVASEFTESHYGFKREWIKRRGLNANRLSVISVAGDSMEPSLYDNDLVLIDHASTDLTDSNIYAVRFSGELYVKRIQRLPNNLVLLISANSAYPPIEIAHPVADGVEVIGRVVASMHEW